jgi:hypothetical protein
MLLATDCGLERNALRSGLRGGSELQVPLKLFLGTALAAGYLTAQVTVAGQKLTTRCDPPDGALARFKIQKNAFLKSQDMFIAGRYAEAIGGLRDLMAQVQQNTLAQTALGERAAEAAIEAGKRAYAISLLKPIEVRDDSDCLARTLLARAYAEDGRSAERDAEISALTALHGKAPKSPAGKLDVFELEKHSVKGGGIVGILYALRPWGPHNTHLYSEILDVSGKMVLRIELNSDDSDQVYFREIHPDLAARGERRFSLDAFGPEHALIRFFDGRPSYDDVRQLILAIAERSSAVAK